ERFSKLLRGARELRFREEGRPVVLRIESHERHALSPGLSHARCGGGETVLCQRTRMYIGPRVRPRRDVRTCGASTRGTSDNRTTAPSTRHLPPSFRFDIFVPGRMATVLGPGTG